MARGSRLVVHADAALAGRIDNLASRRMVFFAGLPGTGKSLLVHQLAHVAGGVGRTVHLLQWDVARPAFEASRMGARYPLVDGVTHAIIRKAAGLWVRHAIVAWHARHGRAGHLLIGETPCVGNRFVELARPLDDRAEALLVAPSCRFAIAVPSRKVRQFLEAERERRAANPRHPREREDAPPHVLRELWRDLVVIAGHLGVTSGTLDTAADGSPPYNPAVYRRVYERVLRHRNVDVIALDVVLPTEALSVYDFAIAPLDLIPAAGEADEFIREAERRSPDRAILDREIARWWQV